ncbi:unnamed protein product [Absidia cylindrospora]
MVKFIFALPLFATLVFASCKPWFNGDKGFGFIGEDTEDPLLGKSCTSETQCGQDYLFCKEGTCQEMVMGVDCLFVGEIWNGSKSCCPRKANPSMKGQPCKKINDA